MKKGILLFIGALILVGVIGLGIWYIQEKEKVRIGDKDAFIPYNSAFVVAVNAEPRLPLEVKQLLGKESEALHGCLLEKVTDSLRQSGHVKEYPYVWAMRVQGRNDITSLCVMDNIDVWAQDEVLTYLNRIFSKGEEKVRKYDRHKIYSLQRGKENVYFAICGNIILVSDSDLYVEDGLKQFDTENEEGESRAKFHNVDKYFSEMAGVNIFMNTEMFTGLLPAWFEVRKLFPGLDVTRLLKWGALDGEFLNDGIALNGFMHYGGLDKSYFQTFAKQQPGEMSIDKAIPRQAVSLCFLNLNNPLDYFEELDNYRYNVGAKEEVFARKQQYIRMFGKGREEELRQLLQGEIGTASLSFDAECGKREGVVVASLKSGGLAKELVEQMLNNHARYDKKELDAYRRKCVVDREKAFEYYQFPVTDFLKVCWGDIFAGWESRWVMVEDNYLVFATSERMVECFVKDYVHGSSIRDAEWYQNLQNKLARKCNFAYFARTQAVLPLYREWAKGEMKALMERCIESRDVFPCFAIQASNEGDLLYNTMFLSSQAVSKDVSPHMCWQTRLEAKLSSKPVLVTNHVDGKREVFVQDDENRVYLINDVGRVLWKQKTNEKINSEVYQVDVFKNGKLQYLFSTPSKIYLIDRNGNGVGCFPLELKSECEQGITVFDYDNKKDYRVFVPCVNKEVYLYDLKGETVVGWKPDKADKPIVSKVEHFRVAGKDYLVFADNYRLYILDRRGKERVRVATLFNLSAQTEIYLVKEKEDARLLFAGADGVVNIVDFSGKAKSFGVEGEGKCHVNVLDVNKDGVDECVVTRKDCLLIYDLSGKLLLKKEFETQEIGYPYVYRFSNDDVRIGLNDVVNGQMFLLSSDGNISEGFPIVGDSPFSIVPSENNGFFLYAGKDKGTLVKYELQ